MSSENSKFNLQFYEKFSYSVVTYTELAFYRLGLAIGKKPYHTIAICWMIVGLSALGYLRFRQEKNPMNLWVPPNSDFARDSAWLMKTVEVAYRKHNIIMTSSNVLVPEILLELLDLTEQLEMARSSNNITWNDVCFKLPHLDSETAKFITRDHDTNIDLTSYLGSVILCSYVDSMDQECYQNSILELWNFDRKIIENLTRETILDRINNHDEMLILGHLKNYKNLLSGVVKNSTGHITAASALENFWMTKVNFTAVDMDKVGNVAGTAAWSSEESLEWESEFEKVVENKRKLLKNDTEMFYMSARSFGDVSSKTLFQDMDKLILGGFIMAIYVQFVISKFNLLELRVILGGIGLLSVGMSFVVGVGLCSIFGVPYGPVHTSLPFLLMGLGVDDMFVIMACWDDLSPEQKKLPIYETIGLVLKHAGVSITITSVTDVMAFLIGCSTILPSLQSYCIYAAVSVFMTYIFAVTFFAACFALDQKRIQNKRIGLLPCIKLKNYTVNDCSQKQMSNRVFHFVYEKIILTPPVKVLVVIIAVIFLALSVKSCFKLEQKFDIEWFVPKSAQLSKYFEKRKNLFPGEGTDGAIYMGALNYTHEIKNIKRIVENLESSENAHDIIDWMEPFRNFVKRNFYTDIYYDTLDEIRFSVFLSKFLFSPRNAKYQSNFQFEKPLECGSPAPNIKMAFIGFKFPIFNGPSQHLPAMHEIQSIAKNANFTTGDRFCTAWAINFATWVTDEVIETEVLRNLQLALLCVMACTVILIADLQICFWVFICVLLSMVNVCRFMQMWGLTIDLVSCIGLELAIGLCVDYAAHIGHTFLTVTGNKNERALKTVTSIGSAVLYGGLSALIGVFMLSQSEAYIFQAFFKIFFLVVVFGLFHGVILFPIILSWVGPQPYKVYQKKAHQEVLEIK